LSYASTRRDLYLRAIAIARKKTCSANAIVQVRRSVGFIEHQYGVVKQEKESPGWLSTTEKRPARLQFNHPALSRKEQPEMTIKSDQPEQKGKQQVTQQSPDNCICLLKKGFSRNLLQRVGVRPEKQASEVDTDKHNQAGQNYDKSLPQPSLWRNQHQRKKYDDAQRAGFATNEIIHTYRKQQGSDQLQRRLIAQGKPFTQTVEQ